MSFGWINAVNAVFVVLLILISVIGQKKSGLPPMQSKHTLMNAGEQVGRYACMALLIVPLLPGWEFGFPSSTAMVMWLILPPLLLVCYAILWTQTKRGSRVLYGLAIVPAVLFLVCSLLLRHWALVAAALLFGVTHALIVRETTERGETICP